MPAGRHAHFAPALSKTVRGILGRGGANHLSTSGQQQGRLFRSGSPSSCEVPQPHPGVFTQEGARSYDAYAFANLSAVPACATVRMSPHAGEPPGLFSAAYLSRFDPADPGVNWLADSGASAPAGRSAAYSFLVPPRMRVVIVVHEVDPGAGAGVPYSLEVEGLSGASLLFRDPRNPANRLFLDPDTGQFLAECGGAVLGTGSVRFRGTALTFLGTAPGSRVIATVDLVRRSAAVNILGRTRCSFFDPNIDDN